MRLGKTMGKLFTVCEWIMKLAYVNALWLFFSIVGLLLFGILPASIAVFTIMRKWLMKETDIPIWRTFLSVYRKEFKKSNILGLSYLLGGAFLAFDFFYLRTVGGALQTALFVPLIMITIFYIITFLYIFPVYVHYELKSIDYVKNAFFLAIMHFHITILMATALAAIIFINLYMPALFPFFSFVMIAFVLMYGGMISFTQIDKRQKKVSGA
jgi:uncharacterized membrane protein YesL